MYRRLIPLVAGAIALAGAGAGALASAYEHVTPVRDPATAKECGACHMPFPPALLPATSWGTIMDGLDRHFGENATLPADTAAEIRAYLTRNAGRGDAVTRITEQSWWQRKHRKISDARWQSKEVGSKANCQACHRGAAQGYFEED